MKIRNGFVSNSSSSSFVCNVCGNVESGMDASASDLGMPECVNGHIFCDGHGDGLPEPKPEDSDPCWFYLKQLGVEYIPE